jgi:peptide/nickel transport system permease protein
VIRRLLRSPVAIVTGTYLALLVIAVVAAPLTAPASPGTQNLATVLAGPSAAHWLGTDALGRDITSRLLYGGRAALSDVATALVAFWVTGIPLGILAGYHGGWLDRLVMRLADLLFAVPAIVVLLMVVAVYPGNEAATMITLGIVSAPGLLRIVRGAAIATRGQLYVTAARMSGLRTVPILRRHILPRLAGPIIVQTSLFCAGALIAESGLSFLGLTRPDAAGPSWGNMVADAASNLYRDPWLLVPSGGVIALTVLAFSLFGDAVRDATVDVTSAQRPRRRPRRARTAAGREPAAEQNCLLELRGLTVELIHNSTPVTVLDRVSLTVSAGEAVGIVGESGCGKSITARAILGLLPAGGRISGGTVFFDGTELTGLSEQRLTRLRGSGIALVSQDAVNSLDPTCTVASQLREVIRRHSSLSRRAADARAVQLLRTVRLPDPASVLRRRPAELSGGMAQRVTIALALAAEPKLLIADEPTTALDVTVQAEILALLRDLRRELGMALILVTHDWGVLADACDRTLVMYAGQIVEEASTQDVYQAARHPYSAALLAANPQLAVPGEELPTIPGRVPSPGAWPPGCRFEPRCPLATPECAQAPVPLIELAPGHGTRCLHAGELTSIVKLSTAKPGAA